MSSITCHKRQIILSLFVFTLALIAPAIFNLEVKLYQPVAPDPCLLLNMGSSLVRDYW